MELMRGKVEASLPAKRQLKAGRLAFVAAAVMATGLAVAGSQFIGPEAGGRDLKQSRVALTSGNPGRCDTVFTERVARELERRVDGVVSMRAGQIKNSLGLDNGYLSFSIGVDSSGRPMIEDAWASGAGGEVDARAIVRALGLSFEGVTLAAPGEGTRCSYTLSSRI